MKKEDVNLLAQLLTGMKEAVETLENAKKRNDLELMAAAKKEILEFQTQINNLL